MSREGMLEKTGETSIEEQCGACVWGACRQRFHWSGRVICFGHPSRCFHFLRCTTAMHLWGGRYAMRDCFADASARVFHTLDPLAQRATDVRTWIWGEEDHIAGLRVRLLPRLVLVGCINR